MPVSLQKGQKVSLTKGNPGLKNVVVGIGWDVNAFDTGGDFDLDGAAFCLTDSGKVSDQKDFVFFGNLTHPSGSVQHLGDNLTGAGDGDDEQIKIDLSKIPANITKIAFTVTIYEAEARHQNFGQVSNAFVRIFNEENGEELLRYDLKLFSFDREILAFNLPVNPVSGPGDGLLIGVGADTEYRWIVISHACHCLILPFLSIAF